MHSTPKDAFTKLKEYPPPAEYITDLAKKVLLTPEDTRLWLEHLHTVLINRKRGAKKAAATRAKSKRSASTPQSKPANNTTAMAHDHLSETYHCGSCGKEYIEQTDVEELWIGCDLCELWYCGSCEGLQTAPELDVYVCIKCRQ